jgi:hypothetical protein
LNELATAGFCEVLQKPIGANVLLTAIRRLAAETGSVGTTASARWDEAQALAAVGGNAESARALRNMFLAELPGQVQCVRTAFAVGDHATVRDQLHRLKASCGFVGAGGLLFAVNRLSAEMTAANFHEFLQIANLQLLSEPPTPGAS